MKWRIEESIRLDKFDDLWGTKIINPTSTFEYKYIMRTSEGGIIWEDNINNRIWNRGEYFLVESWNRNDRNVSYIHIQSFYYVSQMHLNLSHYLSPKYESGDNLFCFEIWLTRVQDKLNDSMEDLPSNILLTTFDIFRKTISNKGNCLFNSIHLADDILTSIPPTPSISRDE